MQIRAEVEKQVKDEVDSQIKEHIPVSLQEQSEDNKAQLSEVKMSLFNS